MVSKLYITSIEVKDGRDVGSERLREFPRKVVSVRFERARSESARTMTTPRQLLSEASRSDVGSVPHASCYSRLSFTF